jgi:hypothetical protein
MSYSAINCVVLKYAHVGNGRIMLPVIVYHDLPAYEPRRDRLHASADSIIILAKTSETTLTREHH